LIRRTSSANADLVLFLFYRKVCSVNLNSAGRIALRKVTKCTYSSSDTKVAAVSKKGIVTAKKKGTATITVQYGRQKKKIKLTVKATSTDYSPSRVAQIANQRLKEIRNRNGEKMVYMPDLLKQQLKKKEITQKEYEKYYPTCGTGYLICFYELNLNETISLSGSRLKTESDIANDIIGYYRAGIDTYFYVTCIGKRNVNGSIYYEFHLHNG
ncbi:Ig-like domain-containing protein, partial [Lachnospiraceae bacterium ZAX-1]